MKRTFLRRALLILGLFALFFWLTDLNYRLQRIQELEREARKLRAQVTTLAQTQIGLQAQLTYAASDQAVEEWARREAGYIREGDHPVVPLPGPGATPALFPTPTVAAPTRSNLEAWWELFFGEFPETK
ncbi:MAG: septum formation initiator family protein [Anaerolineales bacterium]